MLGALGKIQFFKTQLQVTQRQASRIKACLMLTGLMAASGAMTGCEGGDQDAQLKRNFDAQVATASIVQQLKQNTNFSTLVTALETTGLDKTLNELGSATLFAPTNAAFAELGQVTFDDLLNNPDTLRNILLYHVIPNATVSAYDAFKSAGKTVKTANTTLVSLGRWNTNLFVNGTAVTAYDLKATNGVVHTINKVLLPPDITQSSVADVKQKIITLAESYKGIEDSNFTLHATFEPLIAELLTLAPQSPVADRLDSVATAWQQVWGPYDYNSGQQGVNPDVSPDEIYQVISKEGYYYNVTPLTQSDTGEEQIGMLRGEYTFDPNDNRCLNVQFIRFPGLDARPSDFDLWELPALEEANTIEADTGLNRIEIVPNFVVRLFFGGGKLCEIYTDDTLRISLSTEDDNPYYSKLYILTKVSHTF